MCLSCIEYLKGNLTGSEYSKNRAEISVDEHDSKADEKFMAELCEKQELSRLQWVKL